MAFQVSRTFQTAIYLQMAPESIRTLQNPIQKKPCPHVLGSSKLPPRPKCACKAQAQSSCPQAKYLPFLLDCSWKSANLLGRAGEVETMVGMGTCSSRAYGGLINSLLRLRCSFHTGVTGWQSDLRCPLYHFWKNNPKLTSTPGFTCQDQQGLPLFRTVQIQEELPVARASVWLLSRLVETGRASNNANLFLTNR